MKLSTINIENFKNIEHLDFSPTNTTVALIGKNGKGKTSFKEAVYAGITGVFPVNCIKEGERSTSISMTLSDGTAFSRIVNADKANKITVNGRVATAKSLAELLELKTGVSKDAAKIVTSADVLENMGPDDFGNFILTYIPEKLDYDTVVKYIPGITPDIEDVLKDAIPSMPTKFDIVQLKEAYAYFMEQRKFIKKEIAVREARVKSFSGAEPTRKMSDIEADIDSISKKEGGIEAAKTALKIYNVALNNRKKAEENLAKLKAEIDAIDAVKPDMTVLSRIENEIDYCNSTISNARVLIKTIEDNIEVFTNTINNLSKPICPLSEKLVCTTDKTKVKEELEELLVSNKEGLVIQKQIIEVNKTKLEVLAREKADFEKNSKKYDNKVFLNVQYENQRKNIPSLPGKPDVAELEDFSEEKKRLRDERDAVIAYEKYKTELSQIEVFKDKYIILDFLCKTFEPKGEVISSITSHYMSVFETVCNARANELRPGMEIKFLSDEGVSYLLKTSAAADFRTYDSLSSGEKALALFLILDMLNALSQIKILMIDDLDKLDSESFSALIKILQSKSVQDFYDHIIICAVDHPDIVAELSKYTNIDYI